MKVLRWKHIPLLCLKPSLFIQTLALGTMTVAAGVVGDSQCTAIVTFVHMASQLSSSADLNGTHGTQVPEGHLLSMGITIGSSKGSKNMGHLQ